MSITRLFSGGERTNVERKNVYNTETENEFKLMAMHQTMEGIEPPSINNSIGASPRSKCDTQGKAVGRGKSYRRKSSKEHRESSAPSSNMLAAAQPPVVLSPLSSRTAVDAEKESIFCLKREIKALTMALRTLKKHTKEWVMINSRLEIAKEELEAVLEDVNLTRSYSDRSKREDSFSSKEENDVLDRSAGLIQHVPTPPLSAKQQFRCHNSAPTQTGLLDGDIIAASLPPPPLLDEIEDDVQNLKVELDKTEPFSLEYFQIKKKIKALTERSSSSSPPHGIESPNQRTNQRQCSDRSEDSFGGRLLVVPVDTSYADDVVAVAKSIPPQSSPRSSPQSQAMHSIQNLTELLDVVPKYSLEWFQLKKDIKATLLQPNRRLSSASLSSSTSTELSPIPLNRSRSSDYSIGSDSEHRLLSHFHPPSLKAAERSHFCNKSVIVLQSYVRRRRCRSSFVSLKSAAISVQAFVRMIFQREQYRQIIINTIAIQCFVKRWLVRRHNDRDRAFLKVQHQIEEMKIEKLSMEMKLFELQKEVGIMKNAKLRRELSQIKDEVIAIKAQQPSDPKHGIPQRGLFTVLLDRPGTLGMELEHHKNSKGTAIVNLVVPNSQADLAGLMVADIICNFRSSSGHELRYDQFITMAKAGIRPLVFDVRRA